MVIAQNFVLIGQTVAEMWQFFDFFLQNGGRPASWICYMHVWTTGRVFGGIYHCAKFVWNRCSILDNMQVLILNVFGLKMLIHAPKRGFLVTLLPKWGAVTSRPQKALSLQKHVIGRVDR